MKKGIDKLLGDNLNHLIFSGSITLIIPFTLLGACSPELYVVIGLALAYFQFRRSRLGMVSQWFSTLFPGCKRDHTASTTNNLLFKIVDILAVWATVLGVVTSLDLGPMQIASRLTMIYGLPEGAGITGMIIAVITLCCIVSALSGVNRGVKHLSLINIFLIITLLLIFLVAGSFGSLFTTFVQACKDYRVNLIPLSTPFQFFDNAQWTSVWTVFYWAWWVAWAPLARGFIASIGRGRIIREFIVVVMFLLALFSFLFAVALGGTAIHLQLSDQVPLVVTAGKSIGATLFQTLHQFPVAGITVVLATILIAPFFITSADSATLASTRLTIIGMGLAGEHDRKAPLISWGVVFGGLSIILVLSSGIKALQTAFIIGVLPFLFIMFCSFLQFSKICPESILNQTQLRHTLMGVLS